MRHERYIIDEEEENKMKEVENYMDNKACIGEAPVPDRTMKDNIDELNSIIDDCNCLVDRLIEFLWANGANNGSPGIKIMSFETALVSALGKGRYLKERLLSVNARMGEYDKERQA